MESTAHPRLKRFLLLTALSTVLSVVATVAVLLFVKNRREETEVEYF